MATITLEKNEKFEHSHSAKSTTELIFGKLVYHCDGKSVLMKKGEIIVTPANKPHTIENLNDGKSSFNCGHEFQ